MKLYTVTISGADDNTDPVDLAKISEKFPFVEWGILLSPSRSGKSRFPSIKWLEELHKYSGSMRLSGHMCGKYVESICNYGEIAFREAHPKLWDMFHRVQLNFAKQKYEINNTYLPEVLSYVHDKQIIFQIDGVNDHLFKEVSNINLNVAPLFDSSCGNGVRGLRWPASLDGFRCGYAGGLGPDNIEMELGRIREVAHGEIWVDMETNVRSDDCLDLLKVESVLDVADDLVSSEIRAKTFLQTGAGQQKISDSLRPIAK